MKKIERDLLTGVWSATPTPFDERLRLDRSVLSRVVKHHLRLGVRGLFLAGTAGEGMCMPEDQRRQLVRDVVKHARGRLLVAVQTTDNSVARVLDNIAMAREDGADVAVVAQPLFFPNATDKRLEAYYTEIFERSPLPIGLYDRGGHSAISISAQLLPRLLRHPRVRLVKDSSSDPARREIALKARAKRSELVLLCGDEFRTAEYMLAGYDGLLLGGAIFNGYLAGQVIAAVQAGKAEAARKLDRRIGRLNYAVFGGRKIPCWLAGEKRMCVELGLFKSWSNYYGYRLTAGCERNIVRIVAREGPVLKGVAGAVQW